ncbi:TPA: phage tail tip fiber protein, partial [Klebsiella pneumoniae]
SKKLIVARIQPGSTDQTVYLSSPKFERGNVPTAWSEAPEDNASAAAVNALTSRVDSAEGTLTSQGQAITKLNNDLATTNGTVNKKADATALNALTTRVSSAEGKLNSQSSSITSLQNGLTTANQNIGKKADSSAVNTLTNRVSQVENTLTTQSESITSLENSLGALDVGGANLIPRSGTMDGWANKQSGTFKGNAIAGKTVSAGGGNIDIREEVIAAPVDAREYVYSFYAKGGVNGQAVTVFFYNPNTTGKSVNSQGVTSTNTDGRSVFNLTTEWKRYWVKWTQTTGSGTKRLILGRIEASSTTNQTVFICSPKLEAGNVPTAWSEAPEDLASTTAVNSLTTRVTDAENKITAQSQQLTSLQSSLNGKADAGALNSLTSRVTSAEGKITSTANSLTSLNSTVGTLSSTVQAQGNTLVDTNNKISSMYSIKVETNNGKKVGAGIVLGSDGSTSDMILYADRFSLFNRNSKTAVPVMIAEGNELFIDTARIKNGSISSAKVGDLSSWNYVYNSQGWALSKDGFLQINGNVPGQGRTVLSNNGFAVYDSNGVARVTLGLF